MLLTQLFLQSANSQLYQAIHFTSVNKFIWFENTYSSNISSSKYNQIIK